MNQNLMVAQFAGLGGGRLRARVGYLIWWGLLCSMPCVLLVSDASFIKLHPHFIDPDLQITGAEYIGIFYILICLIGLPSAAIVKFFRNWREAMLQVIAYLAMVGMLFALRKMALGLMFIITHPQYAFPHGSYIENHCHPVSFTQDGSAYAFGVCDMTLNSYGQPAFSFVYDTSGDLRYNSFDEKVPRRELADAVRSFFNDDPNEPFEYADFSATPLPNGFYIVTFESQDVAGFTRAYGRPPPNPKNPYTPMLY